MTVNPKPNVVKSNNFVHLFQIFCKITDTNFSPLYTLVQSNFPPSLLRGNHDR